MFRNKKGFTLIELLVVIGILAVLLAITLIAVNPGENLEDADDIKRRSDVNAILNSVNQYMVDNSGALPGSITATATNISDTALMIDLCDDVVPTYIAGLPQDPDSNNGADITDCAVAYDTGYQISAVSGRVTVSASSANEGPITVTR